MNYRDSARVDQLVAVMREADVPLTVTDICTRAGNSHVNGWSVPATVRLLQRLRDAGVICMDSTSCWVLPPDR